MTYGVIYMSPSSEIPLHRHLGDEAGLILQGEVKENSGEIKMSGDIRFLSAGSEHCILNISKTPPLIASAVKAVVAWR